MHPVAILIQNKIDEYYTKKFIYLRKPNDYIHMRLSFIEWILWFQPIWEEIEEDYWQSGTGDLYGYKNIRNIFVKISNFIYIYG